MRAKMQAMLVRMGQPPHATMSIQAAHAAICLGHFAPAWGSINDVDTQYYVVVPDEGFMINDSSMFKVLFQKGDILMFCTRNGRNLTRAEVLELIRLEKFL